jgi:DNA (cytosine-5)-methyltransferase 1
VDLFCGAGGLTNGLTRAGIDVRLGIDIDPTCEFPYTENNNAKFLLKSVAELSAKEIDKFFRKGSVRLLAGCAPCQTFSTYYQKYQKTTSQDDRTEDDRWWLLQHFSRLAKEIFPEIVTMENVPRLINHDVFKQFVEDLGGAGYCVSHCVVNCADYGVPQHRQRLVLLASRLGPIHLLKPSEVGASAKTVQGAIGNLPRLKAGEIYSADPLHQAAVLSETNLLRIRASQPGGTWRDWQRNLIAGCHKKPTGKTYPSIYGRMCWDGPAPAITTQFFGFGNGRFGHPEQDRAISLREGAILQSFPENYVFSRPDEPISKKSVGKLIGNAVPPALGEVIGKSIIAHVENSMRQRRRIQAEARQYV